MTGYPSIDKPWLKFYTEEELKFELPDATIYEHVLAKNQDNLDHVCLNYYGTNITYRDFFMKIDEVASALENYGVKEGDVVTIGMLNSPETIYALFALSKLGAIANTVYPTSSEEELKKCIVESDSHIVITIDTLQDKYISIIDDSDIHTVIVASLSQSMSLINEISSSIINKSENIKLPKDNRFISWDNFINSGNGISRTVHNPTSPVIINYTGGTTGGSKGVLLSSKAVLAVAEQLILGGQKAFFRESTWVQVLPLFIAYGVTCSLMIPLIVGMTLIVRLPMTESISHICQKFKPNHIMYGPAFWEAFADEDANLDLSYFILPITGGDALRENTERKINAYFKKCNSPYKIMNGYGMTEVGAAVSVNYKDKYEFGSIGLPFRYNIVSAFDVETGEELKFNQEGELCILTPSVMLGYLNNEAETNGILKKHSDGNVWVHTGDLGYISERGFIHISGRLKRYMLVIANGVQKKLYSLDVEKVLLKSELIGNCAVVPVNDDKYNQLPVAFISLVNNCTDKDFAENELNALCHGNLGDLYCPHKYYFVDKFPLTKVGKIDYKALEALASSDFSTP